MISVICPVYNESDNIEKILDFFINAKPDDKELIIIDGGSTDGTREVVLSWSRCYDNIILLNNPKKYVPFGLNLAIKLSKGNPIVRLDGHSNYSPDYFEKILETFDKSGADVVGGPMNAVGKTVVQKAIAYATSTIFGTGNSKIHNINFEGYSDHVYLGAWYKEIFEELGNFDERLKVNHDDDFSYRARSKGKKIFLNPEIKSYYFPRSTLIDLLKQYFLYGFEKPMVSKNVISELKFRHIIPPLFSIYFLCLPFYFLYPILFIPLLSYLFLNIYFSLIKSKQKLSTRFLTLVVYPIIHISYGLGYILGIKNIF